MTVLSHPDNLPLPPLPSQPPGVPWPTSRWPTGEPWPGAVPDLLDSVGEAFGTNPHPELGSTLAVAVIHEGHLVAERYGPETDAQTPLISWSMAKSILHALVGIAVGDSRIEVDAPAPVPEWQGAHDHRRHVRVDDLLRMSSGLAFVEDYVDDEVSDCLEMLFGAGRHDMGAYAASKPAVAAPLQVFNYSSGTSNILARLLADLVGRGADGEAWATERLFGPLGMSSARLGLDESGTFVGSSYVHATARDFARFGLLYLRGGVWDGERILPDGWVDGARARLAVDDETGRGYGRHWWIWSDEVFAAQGYETQRIVIDPVRDAIVVRLGKTPVELGPNVDAWIQGVLDAI